MPSEDDAPNIPELLEYNLKKEKYAVSRRYGVKSDCNAGKEQTRGACTGANKRTGRSGGRYAV